MSFLEYAMVTCLFFIVAALFFLLKSASHDRMGNDHAFERSDLFGSIWMMLHV